LEAIVKHPNKVLILLYLVAGTLCANSHATTKQDLKEAYRPATVISVRKLDTNANYAYNVGFEFDCMVYIARYKSANDVVPPQALALNSSVNIRLENEWLHVSLPDARDLTMRLVSANGTPDDACSSKAAGSALAIPPGTILPISLNSEISSDRSKAGMPITATVMQDVPLGAGVSLSKGSKIFGRVLEAMRPGGGSAEAKVTFEFDRVQFGARTVPVTTNLRALASLMEISAAGTPKVSSDASSTRNLVQIGGDQESYGQGAVLLDSKVVGTYTNQGTLAYLSPDLGTECRSAIEGNTRAQAFWVFSAHACGSYGFASVKILHAGRTSPVGRITLVSNGKPVNVSRNSGMLLRVDRNDPAKTSAEAAAPAQ
jgi:hypothetical protein